MRKPGYGFWAIFWASLLSGAEARTQVVSDSLHTLLWGRWEVTAYSEQGVPVDKTAPALPQALAVYEHVRQERLRSWYGVSEYDELSRRENRALDRWQERDSSIEVRRLTEIIALPYYAVFFPDSTLSLYNLDTLSREVRAVEARRYAFAPALRSVRIFTPGNYGIQWHAQVIRLTAERMTLFLAEEAEIVELRKRPFSLP